MTTKPVLVCSARLRQAGFTLIELVMTIVIAAIFITLAVPSYFSMMQNNRVISLTNNLSAAFNQARMEAIKRGVRVSVCSAADSSLSTCGTTAQWAQGWIVFLDADNNNLVDSSNNLVRVNEAATGVITITANNSLVSYDGSGFITSGAFSATIRGTSCTGQNARVLSVSSSGRVSVTRTAC